MSQKNKSTVPTIVTNTPTEDVLAGLKRELAGLSKITGTQFKTSSPVGDGFTVAIADEQKTENLVKLVSMVLGKQHFYNAAQNELSKLLGSSFSIPEFKINGYSAKDIFSDVVLRMQILSVAKRETELKELIKEGETFLTEADKKNIFLAKVAKAGVQPSALGLTQGE